MISAYHEILRISEEEMWQIKNDASKNVVGVPIYYSLDSKGRADFFPALKPAKMLLYLVAEKTE